MPALSVKEFYRFALWMIAGLVCLAAGQFAGRYLAHNPNASVWIRVGAVFIGTACYLPWIGLVVWLIRKSDEFERQVHLFGIAYGFLLAFFALIAIDMLKDSRFIEWST